MKFIADACSRIVPLAVFALLVMPSPAGAGTADVAVAGQADPWLAGMPDGSTASCHFGECSTAPTQSPTHVEDLCLIPGGFLAFRVTGGTAQDPGCPLVGPDGTHITPHHAGADNGMSDVIGPMSCCLAVFLGDEQPDQSPPPPDLDFTSAASRNYLSISPLLKQVFFVGDGLTSAGVQQAVQIPWEATRLFLGTLDSWQWANNIGELSAAVTDPCGPTPVERSGWGMVKALYR